MVQFKSPNSFWEQPLVPFRILFNSGPKNFGLKIGKVRAKEPILRVYSRIIKINVKPAKLDDIKSMIFGQWGFFQFSNISFNWTFIFSIFGLPKNLIHLRNQCLLIEKLSQNNLWEGFQFRWLKIKEIFAAFAISIVLFSDHFLMQLI